jgi:hypothetical protein
LRRAALLRIIGAVAGALIVLVAAELLLRGLPIARGVHPQDPASAAASTRMVPNRAYTWSIGWDLRNVVQGKTNSMGFLSPREYTADRHAIALFGDSFAEAQMLDYQESLAGRIEAHFRGAVDVFNFGLSGASLPHYLGMARELGPSLRFQAAIVVVTPSDYTEGFGTQSGYYKWARDSATDLVTLVPAASPDRTRQVLRELALVRYVRANLKFSPSRLLEVSRQAAPCVPGQLTPADRERVARYVDELPRALGLKPDKLVLVFHTHIGGIYDRVERRHPARSGDCPQLDELALAELRRLAALRGMKLLDATAILENHYRTYRRPLGFEPVDSHWNAMSTALIAREIASLLGTPAAKLEKIARQ